MRVRARSIYLMAVILPITTVLATGGAARAELKIVEAEYKGGVLVVRGETSKPGQIITLDGRYQERTGRQGEFRFRVRYLPRDCKIELRSGEEMSPAVVANCKPTPAAVIDKSDSEADRNSQLVRMRIVRQACQESGECRIVCNSGEYAVNAVCDSGAAHLDNERAVSCRSQHNGDIVAYCLVPQRGEAPGQGVQK